MSSFWRRVGGFEELLRREGPLPGPLAASARLVEHFHLSVALAPSWHRFSSLPWAFCPLSASAGAAVPPYRTTRSGKLENCPRCPLLHPLPLSQAVSVGCFLNIFQNGLPFHHHCGCFHVRHPRPLPGDSTVSPVGLLDTGQASFTFAARVREFWNPL